MIIIMIMVRIAKYFEGSLISYFELPVAPDREGQKILTEWVERDHHDNGAGCQWI